MNTQQGDKTGARPVRQRWWPALVFLVLTAGAIVWVRLFRDVHQQDKNIWTYLLCGACFFCLLLWLLVLSRLPWHVRLQALAAVVLVHLVVLAAVRIKGVDGNLVPILEWRWKQSADLATEAGNSPAASTVTDVTENPVGGWPQFLGPNRNGVVEGIQLETNWTLHPPKEIWRVPVGAGWSGFAIASDRAVTLEQDGEREVVSCFEALTGRRLWSHAYEARYSTTIAGEGPRTTPAIDGGLVYAAGATGWLTCLDLETGHVVWTKNVLEENGSPVPEWGFSVSPLVNGNRVIISAGGTSGHSLIALNRFNGETLWAGGSDKVSYSSPIIARLGGLLQVVVFNQGSVAAHDLETGQLLWEMPYSPAEVHVAAPLVLGNDRVLFSSGYGHGSELYSIQLKQPDIWEATLAWRSRRMKAKFTNLIERDGFIYGLDDGILACISADTGELQWKDGRYGHGQIVLVGDYLLVMSERGVLAMVEPSPERWIELGSFEVFSSKTWNPPALAGNYLFLRTDQEAVCLLLP